MKIGTEVMRVLDGCRVEGNLLYLANIQLDRKLYIEVNKVLDLMGGKWNRGKQAHVFSIDNVAELLNQCIETGEITDIYKELQFFETPQKVIDIMMEHARIESRNMLVLEPSAGKGAIVRALLATGASVDYCEIHGKFSELIAEWDSNFVCGDFLHYNEDAIYDRIVANPPFSNQQDVDHANKMLDLLAPGGVLVCIMASSVMWRNTQRTKLFHARLNIEADYEFIELPEGSFKESGTMVNTVMLVAEKG